MQPYLPHYWFLKIIFFIFLLAVLYILNSIHLLRGATVPSSWTRRLHSSSLIGSSAPPPLHIASTAFQAWLWFQLNHSSCCFCDFYPILLKSVDSKKQLCFKTIKHTNTLSGGELVADSSSKHSRSSSGHHNPLFVQSKFQTNFKFHLCYFSLFLFNTNKCAICLCKTVKVLKWNMVISWVSFVIVFMAIEVTRLWWGWPSWERKQKRGKWRSEKAPQTVFPGLQFRHFLRFPTVKKTAELVLKTKDFPQDPDSWPFWHCVSLWPLSRNTRQPTKKIFLNAVWFVIFLPTAKFHA